MRNTRFLALILAAGALTVGRGAYAEPLGNSVSNASLVRDKGDFDSRSLYVPEPGSTRSSFSMAQPGRFSMQQSYSLSYAASGMGSSSWGLYLNTLMVRLSDPLTLSADVGFYTPFHSSVPGMQDKNAGALGSSLILPRMGLEYRPNDHTSVSVQLFNGRDAWKAYGNDPFNTPTWSRFP